MSRLVEEWRAIRHYEGLYEVSDWGRVRSLDRVFVQKGRYGNIVRMPYKGQILKPIIQNDGYIRVYLSRKPYLIHKLVAEAFLPIPQELQHLIGTRKLVVGHIKPTEDGKEDKTANEAWNIKWMSLKENNDYGTINERRSVNNVNNPKQSKLVYQYTLDGELVNIWKSTRECGRNGFKQRHISNCCLGKEEKYKGYKWSYKPL